MAVMTEAEQAQAEANRKDTAWMSDYTRACLAFDLWCDGLNDIPFQRRWHETAIRLGYTGHLGHIAAELAAYRVDQAEVAEQRIRYLPIPWRRRVQDWNRELAEYKATGKPIPARPTLEGGYVRFAVPRPQRPLRNTQRNDGQIER
jgi:hypothetical protein